MKSKKPSIELFVDSKACLAQNTLARLIPLFVWGRFTRNKGGSKRLDIAIHMPRCKLYLRYEEGLAQVTIFILERWKISAFFKEAGRHWRISLNSLPDSLWKRANSWYKSPKGTRDQTEGSWYNNPRDKSILRYGTVLISGSLFILIVLLFQRLENSHVWGTQYDFSLLSTAHVMNLLENTSTDEMELISIERHYSHYVYFWPSFQFCLEVFFSSISLYRMTSHLAGEAFHLIFIIYKIHRAM